MSWDRVWEDLYRQDWGSKYPAEVIIRFVARNFYKVSIRKDIKILEIGCGSGANLWYMAREGFTVYGIDGSETAISCARDRLDTECAGWQGELIVGDISRLPFPDDFFDAVVDHLAVYCNSFNISKEIYKEMIRVCKKGGKLSSRTFATGCWGDNTGDKVGHNAYLVDEGPIAGKGYTRFTDLNEIQELLSGAEILEIELLNRTAMLTNSAVNNRQNEIKEWLIVAKKI